MKELNKGEEHKNYFIILNLLNAFFKNCVLEDLNYIMLEELIHLWLRNMNVMNQFLKGVSLKIENRIVDLFSKYELS